MTKKGVLLNLFKKETSVIFILLFLVISIFITAVLVRQSIKTRSKAASIPDTVLSLVSPDAGSSLSPNEEFTVNVMLDPKDKDVSGIEAHFTYPTNLVEMIQNPTINTLIFPNELQNKVNTNTGTIDIAAGIALPGAPTPTTIIGPTTTPGGSTPIPTNPPIPTATTYPGEPTVTPVTIDCSLYTSNWVVNSITPSYIVRTGGIIYDTSLTINGNFPHIQECGLKYWQTNTPGSLVYGRQGNWVASYSILDNEIQIYNETQIVTKPIFLSVDGMWEFSINHCIGITSDGRCLNGVGGTTWTNVNIIYPNTTPTPIATITPLPEDQLYCSPEGNVVLNQNGERYAVKFCSIVGQTCSNGACIGTPCSGFTTSCSTDGAWVFARCDNMSNTTFENCTIQNKTCVNGTCTAIVPSPTSIPSDTVTGSITIPNTVASVDKVVMELRNSSREFIKVVDAQTTSNPLVYTYSISGLTDTSYILWANAFIGNIKYSNTVTSCTSPSINNECVVHPGENQNYLIDILEGNSPISGNLTVNNPGNISLESVSVSVCYDTTGGGICTNKYIFYDTKFNMLSNPNGGTFNFPKTVTGTKYRIYSVVVTQSRSSYSDTTLCPTPVAGRDCFIISPGTQNFVIDIPLQPTITSETQAQTAVTGGPIQFATMKFRLKTGAAGIGSAVNLNFIPGASIVTEVTAPTVIPINVLGSVNNLTLAIEGAITPTPGGSTPTPGGPTSTPGGPTPTPGGVTPTIPPGTPLVKFKVKFRSVSVDVGQQLVKVIVKNDTTGLLKEYTNLPTVFESITGGYTYTSELPLIGVPAGSGYKIYVKGPKHLARGFRNITLNAGSNALFNWTASELEPGDLPPQDGVINSQDISRLIELLGDLNPSQARLDIGDLNYDGAINGADTNELILTLSTKYDESQY